MKTNRRIIELYYALEDGALKGVLEGKILMFKNIKQIEAYVYPMIESKKIIDKMLANYHSELMSLYQEYKVEFIGNQPTIPKFVKNEDGTFDTNRIDPKFLEFQEKDDKILADNKALLAKYKSDIESFEELMDKIIDTEFSFVSIPKELIPDDINSLPLLEFGIIEIN